VGYNPLFLQGGWLPARERSRAMVRRLRKLMMMTATPALLALLTAGAVAAADGARLDLPAGAQDPGMVRLELAPALETDPPGSVRLQMVLQGPLAGEHAGDLYAFNAVLELPGPELTFVSGSVRKGELLGRDGGNWLVTAAAQPGPGGEITFGGSRIGAVPGIAAPDGPSALCSFALKVSGAGPFALEWEDAAFIDSHIRRLDVARFAGAILQPQAAAPTAQPEDHP